MDCKFDAALLHDYLEGTIDDLEKIFVDEHLKVCRKCKKELTLLKLLFWELEGISDEDIELPVELEYIREKAVDNIMADESEGFGIKKLLNLQKKNLETSNMYINYIPGKDLFEKGIKKSSSILYNASEKALKKSIKIIQSRS
jgi:hypothetical protein